MTTQLPRGVIFDMDGVLLDSEPFICKAAMMMFAEKGLVVKPEDFHPFVGAGEDRYIGGVAEHYHFPLDLPAAKNRTYDIYLEIIKGNLQPLAGVHEFIDKCRKLIKKIAVASSADLRKVRGNMQEIKLPFEVFDAIVTGEDVVHKKPSPDIFLIAAKRIGCLPGDCLVVEDAVNGVQAAKSAGAKCLALTTSFSADKFSDADFIAADLSHAPDEVLNWK
jgi:HAD superfamily hydrolase (TIGR01509 family)